MKIFVTGGSGLLGSSLLFELTKKHEVISGDHSKYIKIKKNAFSHLKIDICKSSSLKNIESNSPDVIIHAAALTDLEFCEKNPKIAYDVNVKGTQNVLKVARKCNAKIIYFCTDYIFDGKRGDYSENDTPNPLSVYAKTKLQGENLVKKYANHVSIRTSLYGWSINPDKPGFASWIIDSLRENKKTPVITDQKSSLIFTNNLAKITDKILENDLTGVYNVASKNSISKYNFALKIAKTFNLNKNLIEPISLKGLVKKLSLSAKRPKNISLNVSKIEDILSEKMPTITDGIKSMKKIEKEFKGKVTLHEY